MAQLLTNPTCGWLFPFVESLSGRKVERDDLFACVRDEQVAMFLAIWVVQVPIELSARTIARRIPGPNVPADV
jgi:hypothetical protein